MHACIAVLGTWYTVGDKVKHKVENLVENKLSHFLATVPKQVTSELVVKKLDVSPGPKSTASMVVSICMMLLSLTTSVLQYYDCSRQAFDDGRGYKFERCSIYCISLKLTSLTSECMLERRFNTQTSRFRVEEGTSRNDIPPVNSSALIEAAAPIEGSS